MMASQTAVDGLQVFSRRWQAVHWNSAAAAAAAVACVRETRVRPASHWHVISLHERLDFFVYDKRTQDH